LVSGEGISRAAVVSESAKSPDPEWDEFVDGTPGGGHLQTSLWAEIKARSGWRAVRLHARRGGELVGGCQLLVRRARVGAIGYCQRGPLARDRDPEVIGSILDALGPLARRRRILYVKVQPPPGGEAIEPELRQRGFVASAMSVAYVATVRVDLRRDSDRILAGMRHSKRQAIRQAAAKGVVVREAGAAGLPTFGALLEDTRRRRPDGFSPYPLELYGEMLRRFGDGKHAQLVLAEYQSEVLAGAFNIAYGDTVYGLMSAWSGRHPKLHPNELMHWYGMQWGHERGYHYFDFDGILESVARAKLAGEELPEEGRRGNTAYKLGMGGDVTVFPRAYDRSFHPLFAWPTRVLAPRVNPTGTTAIRRLRGRKVK
jgi:lipid II:glycine glycyltransferase (peptidoglycan interpeptide bridge formation enzyme)